MKILKANFLKSTEYYTTGKVLDSLNLCFNLYWVFFTECDPHPRYILRGNGIRLYVLMLLLCHVAKGQIAQKVCVACFT